MKQRFAIVLEGSDAAQPAIVRLRQLLKLALRAFGFRCVRIEEASGAATTEAGR